MFEVKKLYTCPDCGTEGIAERMDPLQMRYRNQQAVIVFGLRYCHCPKCSSFFTGQPEAYKRAVEQARKIAINGHNTLIL